MNNKDKKKTNCHFSEGYNEIPVFVVNLIDGFKEKIKDYRTSIELLRDLHAERIARLSQISIPFVRKILEKFERLRYVISTPIRRRKHPSKLIKEFLQRGKHPEIYEYVEKEYRITRKLNI